MLQEITVVSVLSSTNVCLFVCVCACVCACARAMQLVNNVVVVTSNGEHTALM
jgi:hypothetical protein